jgi:hypothetical protein
MLLRFAYLTFQCSPLKRRDTSRALNDSAFSATRSRVFSMRCEKPPMPRTKVAVVCRDLGGKTHSSSRRPSSPLIVAVRALAWRSQCRVRSQLLWCRACCLRSWRRQRTEQRHRQPVTKSRPGAGRPHLAGPRARRLLRAADRVLDELPGTHCVAQKRLVLLEPLSRRARLVRLVESSRRCFVVSRMVLITTGSAPSRVGALLFTVDPQER